jgi:protoheme IX farnesyltransferase
MSQPPASPGRFKDILALAKLPITAAVTLTTATGWFLAGGRPEWKIFYALLGVFLLACGAAALNQCQEIKTDRRMKRTANRPLPAGRLRVSVALFLAGLLILLGLYFLSSTEKNVALLIGLGAFAVFWYNGVYTYLKRITAFAVIPGALLGAIPPVIGWAAAGGDPLDPLILLIAAFFFVWQIPHFWLLLLMHGEQYAEAGLPTLTRVFSRRQLLRITFMWVMSVAVAGTILPALARDAVAWSWALAIVCASVWLGLKSLALLRPSRQSDPKAFLRAFLQINIYALLTMLCLSLTALCHGPAGGLQ